MPRAATAKVPVRDELDQQTLTRSDQVRRQISEKIIAGEFRPGEELDEKRLAETFNVSRTPVREALSSACRQRTRWNGVRTRQLSWQNLRHRGWLRCSR